MNPREYIVEAQNPTTGFWREVIRIPVPCVKRIEIHRFLWIFKTEWVFYDYEPDAIQNARHAAYDSAMACFKYGSRATILEVTHPDDEGWVTRYTVWKDGKWQ